MFMKTALEYNQRLENVVHYSTVDENKGQNNKTRLDINRYISPEYCYCIRHKFISKVFFSS